MELTLDEKQVNELLTSLAEMPAKYSMSLIQAVKQLWHEQNPEEKPEEEKSDDTPD